MRGSVLTGFCFALAAGAGCSWGGLSFRIPPFLGERIPTVLAVEVLNVKVVVTLHVTFHGQTNYDGFRRLSLDTSSSGSLFPDPETSNQLASVGPWSSAKPPKAKPKLCRELALNAAECVR